MPTERRSTIQSVAWVLDMHRSRQLDLDPPYQRRSVWNRQFKQFFIDSILKNYPVPPIFINVEVQASGASTYHVVDGKQRLLALVEFLEDKIPVSKEKYSPPDLAGKYFSQLDPMIQRKFFGYYLPVEFLNEIDPEEVTEIFDRFNRNVQRLNEQELRHAKYGGAFITLMESLAEQPLWAELGLIGQADMRRMKDVEYVSVLFVLTMRGIQEGDPLDEIYSECDEEIPNRGQHLQRFDSVKSMILNLRDTVTETRFQNRADFYSLWSTLLQYSDNPEVIDIDQTAVQLRAFGARVDAVPDRDVQVYADDEAFAYSQAVRAGTTKQPNRRRRMDILIRYIIRR